MNPPKTVIATGFSVGLIFFVPRFVLPALGYDLSQDTRFVLEFIGAMAWALALITLLAMGYFELLERLSGADDE